MSLECKIEPLHSQLTIFILSFMLLPFCSISFHEDCGKSVLVETIDFIHCNCLPWQQVSQVPTVVEISMIVFQIRVFMEEPVKTVSTSLHVSVALDTGNRNR